MKAVELGPRLPSYSAFTTVFLSVLLGFIIMATIVGNVLVCVSVCFVRRLRRPSNYLLVSLAISDLCVATLVMPLALHFELTGLWTLGQKMCDVWIALDMTCCTASILNLCAISIDRYFTISKPLTYGVNKKARWAWLSIAFVWLLAALISVPPMITLGNEYGSPQEPRCDVSQNAAYQLYATLGSFYIPLIVIILMYLKIYVTARNIVKTDLSKHEHRKLDHINLKPTKVCQNFAEVDRYPLTQSSRLFYRSRMGNLLRERKASFTLGLIVAAFTMCWLPFFVVALLRSLFKDTINVPDAMKTTVLWLGYANSMLNPVIYVTFHKDFRKSFREIICFRCATVNEVFRQEASKAHCLHVHHVHSNHTTS